MEDLSPINHTIRRPCRISVPSYFRDHHIEGRVVLPAVEAMLILAEAVRQEKPATDIKRMNAIRFDKFLYVPPQENRIDAFVEIDAFENGDLEARLMTKTKAGKALITRVREHAKIRYIKTESIAQTPPLDLNAALEGICFKAPFEKIYSELIPFGPSYRNVKKLYVSEHGALAEIVAPAVAPASRLSAILGTPFVLDAAFHAACVWGQRFQKTTSFPVAVDQRQVHALCEPGSSFYCRVLPVRAEHGQLVFDIWIYALNGERVESLDGVQMRDVSGGRLKPPSWIAQAQRGHWEHFEKRCLAVTLIERETVMPFAEKTLSRREKERFKTMGAGRRNSYLSARLALKRLSRELSEGDRSTPPGEIETVAADGRHPVCSSTDNTLSFPCSVSHDNRFVIAVAAKHAVGVDVEALSPRVLKSTGLFMSAKERLLVERSDLEPVEAAVRVWCIKEAVAKACAIHLADAWQRVEVVAIGRKESRVTVDALPSGRAQHHEVESHVFTLFSAANLLCESPVEGSKWKSLKKKDPS